MKDVSQKPKYGPQNFLIMKDGMIDRYHRIITIWGISIAQ